MILFSILLLLALNAYFKEKRYLNFLGILALNFLVLAFFLLEHGAGGVEFLISDGYRYFENPERWIVELDRSFWGYVNLFVKNYDIGGQYFIKILNIPVLLLFLYNLRKTFPVIKNELLIIFTYPYFLFLSISNLRDLAISLIAILIIRNYHKKRFSNYAIVVALLIPLYTLRPFMCITAVLSIAMVELISMFKKQNEVKNRNAGKRLAVFGGIFLISIAAYPIVRPKINSYIYNGTYTFTAGYLQHATTRKAEDIIDPNNFGKTILLSHLRYLFTPLPQSMLFESLLTSKASDLLYGQFSEWLRLYGQFTYFGLIFLLVFKWKYIYKSLKSFNRVQWTFILWSLAFFPIYSLVHFGGSHQRLKLPFQIVILLIYLHTLKIKSSQQQLANA